MANHCLLVLIPARRVTANPADLAVNVRHAKVVLAVMEANVLHMAFVHKVKAHLELAHKVHLVTVRKVLQDLARKVGPDAREALAKAVAQQEAEARVAVPRPVVGLAVGLHSAEARMSKNLSRPRMISAISGRAIKWLHNGHPKKTLSVAGKIIAKHWIVAVVEASLSSVTCLFACNPLLQ